MKSIRPAVLTAIGFCASVAFADNCADILKYGVWESVVKESAASKAEEFLSFACSSNGRIEWGF